MSPTSIASSLVNSCFRKPDDTNLTVWGRRVGVISVAVGTVLVVSGLIAIAGYTAAISISIIGGLATVGLAIFTAKLLTDVALSAAVLIAALAVYSTPVILGFLLVKYCKAPENREPLPNFTQNFVNKLAS